MIRASAALALVLLVPAAGALGLDVDSDVQAAASANETALLNVTAQRSVAFQIDAGLFDDHSPDDPTTEIDGGVVASPSAPSVTAPVAAAGLAALLTVAVGLAAYHWGNLKFATLGFLVPLFSRIQGDHVLDHGVRQRVHQAVSENPGITLKEVASTVGIGWGTAVHHLGKLEQERLIVSERSRQFRRFYKNGGGIVNDQKAAFGELKHPTCQRIAVTILARPGQCQKEVCEEVGISAPLAHKYLGRLHEVGLIESQREWKAVKYFPTPRLQELLAVTHPEAPPVVLAVTA